MQVFTRGLFSSGVAFALIALVACATDSEPERNNGVGDVLQACQIRATWKKATSETCINCMAAAPAAKCDCEQFKEFGALCELQQNDRHANPECTSALDDCVHVCPRTDCACLDGCYAQASQCKALSGKLDGCVTAVCAPYCQ